ncbi:hypothetical protein [Montanilutibacter psychrotolerans]|uniref:hypothetical protein n=1 Tax=Montanilutibacter psychrotolerans TaxID=1327343 RepID=UPI0011CE2AD6|nr:hypothetical protein [Lysobacter psychrotolerans]
MKMANLLLVVCLGVAFPASGGDAPGRGVLDGNYVAKNGPFEVDPDPEDGGVRVYMSIKNEGARVMYEAMEGRASSNFCGDGDTLVKRAGNVICFKSAGGYECVFALNMDSGELEDAAAC